MDDGGLDDADADGLTPFLTAAKNGHRGAVQSLLGWGEDKEVDVMSQVVAPPTPPPDTPLIPGGPLVGKNALFLAVEGNHTDMLKVVTRARASLYMKLLSRILLFMDQVRYLKITTT